MRFTAVTLQCAQQDALARFYGTVLGLPFYRANGALHLQCGATRLSFYSAPEGDAPFYHIAFNIPAGSIEAAERWLQDKVSLLYIEDYKGTIAEFVNWDARAIYFYDPAGNVVELIARNGIHAARTGDFSAEHLLSVSEVGIALPSEGIAQQTEQWLDWYRLQYFKKQPPFPAFKAVGDDQGLLILVTEGRAWYPTQKKAVSAPVSVVFLNGDATYRLTYPAEP